jgi:predicted dehydrogenase
MIDAAGANLEKVLDKKPKQSQDFREVLDDKDVDVVVNATPDHWHALITCLALDAGKHVYTEKPASYCIDDGKAMVAAQERHPELVVQVGTQQRSGQHFIDAKAFIDGGGLGTLGFARAWIVHDRGATRNAPDSAPPATLDYDLWLGPGPERPYNENFCHYNWHWLRDFGTGEMGNWGAHWLDVARWLAGLDLPQSVAGFGGTYVVHDDKEWPDTQTVLYEYPGFTLLWEQRLWTKYGVNGRGSGVEIGGELGSIVIDRGGWTFFPKEGEPVQYQNSDLELAHARNFADAIQGKAKTTASMETGHKSAVLCHLGNITALLNRRLEFDAESQSFPNDAEARAFLARDYRSPWMLPA